MNKVSITLSLLLLTVACDNNVRRDRASYFSVPQNNRCEISIDTLQFVCDTLQLPNTSYQGFTEIRNDKIYFADMYFSWIYEMNANYGDIKKHVGQGRGHGEIPLKKISAYTIDAEGNHIVCGTSNDIYTISPSFEYKGDYYYERGSLRSRKKWERDEFYCPSYGDLVLKKYRNHYYFNVNGGDRDFTAYLGEPFFNVAHTILEVDDKSGEVTRLMGRITPAVKYLSAFYFSNYDMDTSGNFYYNFRCDTLVYKYDNDYNLLSSFGFAGRNMDMSCEEMLNNGKGIAVRINDTKTKGHFANITVIGDYVFRPYRTGGTDNHCRMQIYKNEVLVGDVRIPELFRVAGYIEPYFYSEIIGDDDALQLTIYRFKL